VGFLGIASLFTDFLFYFWKMEIKLLNGKSLYLKTSLYIARFLSPLNNRNINKLMKNNIFTPEFVGSKLINLFFVWHKLINLNFNFLSFINLFFIIYKLCIKKIVFDPCETNWSKAFLIFCFDFGTQILVLRGFFLGYRAIILHTTNTTSPAFTILFAMDTRKE